MPIKRSSDQKKITLEQFYEDLSKNSPEHYKEVDNKMLEFIQVINETFKETQLWGLISHSRLVIQSKDTWKSKWFLIIGNTGTSEYYFEYFVDNNHDWHEYIVGKATLSIMN